MRGRPTLAAKPRRDLGDPLRREPEERIGAELDGDRALGVVAQREARDAQERRLLLDAAGVRQHPRRRGHEREELEVAEGIEQRDALGRDEAGGGNGNGFSSGVQSVESDVPIDTGDFEAAPVAAGASDEDIPF